jgi:hypothetical protein
VGLWVAGGWVFKVTGARVVKEWGDIQAELLQRAK